MFTLEFSENLICAEALLGSEVQGSQLVASQSKEKLLELCRHMCERALWTKPAYFVPHQNQSKLLLEENLNRMSSFGEKKMYSNMAVEI